MSTGLRNGLLVLGGAVLLVVGWVWLSPYYSTQLWWFLRGTATFLLLPAVVLLGTWLATSRRGGRYRRRRTPLPVVLLFAVEALGLVGWWFAYDYVEDLTYSASIRVTDDPLPDLQVRVPFSVSTAQAQSNLGDIPGDTQDTTYLPTDRTFVTLVEKRGNFTGYQTLLEQQISTSARNTPSRCDFAEAADRRLGGWWGNSLERAVNTGRRWVSWHQADVYGWCDPTGRPFVVIPLVEQDGLFVVTERPAGIALYDGRTGTLEFRDDAAGIPGPSYPLSIAAAQREASGALGDFGDWFFNRAGWEQPDEADSINSDNDSEFVLAGTAGGEFLVTPQSGRGAATAISVFTVVDAQQHAPDYAPLVVHRLGSAQHPVWQSATAVTDRVRANFGDVFAQQRESDIFELAPTGPDTFVASIGTPQNLLYRVTGRGDLSTDPCLVALTGEQLRCGPTGQIGLSTGNPAAPGAPPVAPVPAGSDLTTLTPEQLVDLNRRTAEELARRLGTPGG